MNRKVKPDKLSLNNLLENTKECNKSLLDFANAVAKKYRKKESSFIIPMFKYPFTITRP